MHHPFTHVASVPVDTGTARVHEEGRQSRSAGGAYALDATPYRPTGDNRVESTGGLMASSDRLLSPDPWGVTTTRRLLSGVDR
ncbi:hypothetical protein WBG99_22860 [Streptomyces sp. TG1A-60]|uniref:hypothetical protein n=1 Tax=Streptomyces sp. TG1A-60 TaxID=3129111 RepID=UPI0030CE2A62